MLYLHREALALDVPKSEVEVIEGGRAVIYKGKCYGVNGVHHYNGDLMIGLFGPIAQIPTVVGSHPSAHDSYPDRHPCRFDGCTHTVQFDDEPYCFTHSPDEGSSVPGYSDREATAVPMTNKLWGSK